MRKTKTDKMVWSGVFMALGIVMPFLTGQIPGIGKMLLPMHFPVMVCGFVCGAPYGLTVGGIVPLLRSALFGMPVLYPTAVSMAFELGTYGLVTGLLYNLLPKKNRMIYPALISAMMVGRLVAGVANAVLYGVRGESYSMQLFMTVMFVNAMPGILLQLILVPVVIVLFRKAKVLV